MSDVSTLPAVNYAGPGTPQPQRTYYGLTAEAWTRITLITLVMGAIFWPNLRRLWLKTNFFTGEANWQHAPLVPLIGLYYLYLNREALLKAPVRPILWNRFFRRGRLGVGGLLLAAGTLVMLANTSELVASAAEALAFYGMLVILLDWGLGTMLFGLLTFGYGIWPGQNDFVKDFGMVITIFGVVTMLCGWEVMKIAWFPIVFLVAAIPWPELVYQWVAQPLQVLAAGAAVLTLKATGVDAVREGTKLTIGIGVSARTLNVAEACAGLKSLMAFVTLAAAIGFLSIRPLWQKITVALSAIPIAIFCNMLRVSGQGLLDHYVSRQLSDGFAHQFVGMVMLIPAFFLILLVAYILDNLFIEETDRRLRAGAAAGSGGGSPLVIEIPARRSAAGPSSLPSSGPAAAAAAEDLAAATRRLMGASLRKRSPQRPPESGDTSQTEAP